MKILIYVDLGKAFERLKNDLIEVEKMTLEEKPTIQETGEKYARAYGRLSASVQCHISANTDTDYGFLGRALKEAENGYNEAPTLLLYEQTHWKDEGVNDIPENLFTAPNGHGALAD